MQTNCGGLFTKKLIIKERPLSSIKSQPRKLIQTSNIETVINFEKSNLKYAPKNSKDDAQSSTQQKNVHNKNPIINGIISPTVNIEKHLLETQNKNETIAGWSAKEIVQYRNEIEQSIKPETLAALRKMAESRKRTANKIPSDSVDQRILTKIQTECQAQNKIVKNECASDSLKQSEDYSFLPISPNNNYVNMNKVDMDKVEWMKQVDTKTAQSNDKSVRFHLDGTVLTPWEEENQHNHCLSTLTAKTESCLEDALRHHGDEPDRAGYTVTELFWLARSAFPAQRSVAVLTLVRVLAQSRRLAHIHRLGTPSALGALIECGLPFLARWLIDDALDALQPLHEALLLLHGIIVVNNYDADGKLNNNVDDIDHIELCWPSRAIAASSVHLTTSEAHRNRCNQLELPLSERAVIHDDIAMQADLVDCLVTNTGLLDRLDFLLITRSLVLPVPTCVLVTDLLDRIARHSIASAALVARSSVLGRLLADHLLPTGNRCHPHHISHSSKDGIATGVPEKCVAHLVRLVRVLAANRSVTSLPLLTVLDGLYPWLGGSNNVYADASCAVTVESVRLSIVLWDRDIVRGVIASVTPALGDRLEALLSSPSLIDDCHQTHLTHTLLALAVAFASTTAAGLPASIESYVQRALSSSFACLSTLIPDASVAKRNCSPLLAGIVHLAMQASRFLPGSRYETAMTLQNTVVLPIVPVLISLMPKLSGDALVLGREHREPGLTLWSAPELPGDGRLLCNALSLTEYTRNPDHVDVAPHTVSLHHGYALLSTVSQALSVFAAAGVLSNTGAIHAFLHSSQVWKLVHDVACCPIDKIATCSPHSGLVQLQLEAVSRLVLCLADVGERDRAHDLHRAAFKLLPYLGPRLTDIARLLIDRVIFNAPIIAAMGIDSSIVTSSLLDSLPRIAQTYKDCFPELATAHEYGCQNATTICIDSFPLMTETSNNSGLCSASRWIDAPFERYYRQQQMRDNESSTTILTERVIDCLQFVHVLKADINQPTMWLRRLIKVMLAPDWTDHFSSRIDTRQFVEMLTKQCLSRPDAIDIDSKMSSGFGDSFFTLYTGLIEQFFSAAVGDPLLANLVVFPCAMRFPIKFRKTLWKMYFDNIRMINIDLSESVFPITEYLDPEESDAEFMQHYWQALKNGLVLEERNPLLYWICVHHINRFVYRRSVSTGTGASMVQQGFAHLLCNPNWQNSNWVRHVRTYKHFELSSPQFYEVVPLSRVQHLEQLRDTADCSVKRFVTAPKLTTSDNTQ